MEERASSKDVRIKLGIKIIEMNKLFFKLLDDFHSNFRGDTPQTFQVCHNCGGKCEYNKLSSLLPGEAEYMALKIGMTLEDFRDKYLDGVMR